MCSIRSEVESTFNKVSSHMNYVYFMDYQFAFECPSQTGREHLCVIDDNDATPELMMCLQDVTDKKPEKLSSCHRVWFGEVCCIAEFLLFSSHSFSLSLVNVATDILQPCFNQ